MASAVPMDTIAGPFGFAGGNFWSFRPVNKINQIVIHYTTGNNPIALTFSSTRDDGSKDTITVGGGGPEVIVNTDTVNIDNADEYLVHFSGTLGTFLSNNVVRSIKFTTNLKDYGPFGPNVGEPFMPVNVVPNKIVGFVGRAGYFIDAIDFVPGIQIPKEILVGAWGGPGGSKWDFKPKGLIKQISITHGTIIDSITFTGVSADGRVEAPIKLGGPGGSKTIQVNINGPSEYLRGVSGTYGNHHGLTVIRSIMFETNVTTHGPHGSNDGTPFSFVVQDGKIVGFHGRAGDFVDAIGVYVTSI